MALFDWQSVQDRAADAPDSTVFISGMSKQLIIDALGVMLDKFRWGAVSPEDWDLIESAVSNALAEVMIEVELPAPAGYGIDEFDRPDGNMSDWHTDGDYLDYSWATMVISGGAARCPGAAFAGALFNAQQFGPDLEMEIEVGSNLGVEFGFHWAMANARASSVSGYGIFYETAGTELSIARLTNNATYTFLDSNPAVPLATGDIIRVRHVGSSIKAFKVVGGIETEVLDATDATYSRVGSIGIYAASNVTRIAAMRAKTL